jgi:predicted RNase H-like HicB family nuclease
LAFCFGEKSMQPLKINAMWDDEASVWVATSQDVDGLAIEASTIDALIQRLKIVIPELIELNHHEKMIDDVPFMLDGFIANRMHYQ